MLWPLLIKLQLCKKVGGVADLGNFEKKRNTTGERVRVIPRLTYCRSHCNEDEDGLTCQVDLLVESHNQ